MEHPFKLANVLPVRNPTATQVVVAKEEPTLNKPPFTQDLANPSTVTRASNRNATISKLAFSHAMSVSPKFQFQVPYTMPSPTSEKLGLHKNPQQNRPNPANV